MRKCFLRHQFLACFILSESIGGYDESNDHDDHGDDDDHKKIVVMMMITR